MSQQNKIRLAGTFLIVFAAICWVYPTLSVYRDYIALLSHADVVQISVITLWVPLGFLGPLACILWMTPKTLYLGVKFTQTYTQNAMQIANKIAIYSALLGVAFAAGWTYHSLDLLERYGYVYSRDLTRITPTGIHLMYVKLPQY